MEEWRPMVGHNGYLISNEGRIYNLKTGKHPRGYVNKHGYAHACLCENGKRFDVALHREVAKAFLQEAYGKTQVNHIDGNKTNNNVGNLEWCTAKENSLHARRVLMKKVWNCQKVVCVETGDVFESYSAAARSIGANDENIRRCAIGVTKTCKKRTWKKLD